MKTDKKIFISTIIACAIIACIIGFALNSASFHRTIKSLKSDYTGGINRTITVYDYNGNTLKEYKGKFDVQESDGGKIMFDDQDGKRVIIYNAIVINEENIE